MADGELSLEFEFKNRRFKQAADGLMAFGKSLEKSWAGLPGILKDSLKEHLEGVVEALAKRHGNPWPAGTTSTSLSRRSGELIAAIRSSVQVYGSSFAEVYGTIGAPGIVYARIHEEGGTITPKNSKYLTVPLPAALNSDGTPKQKSARDWGNTTLIRSRSGSLLIVQKLGKDIVPLYVLKKSVYIPPRLQMAQTLRVGVPYFVDKAMERMLGELQKGLAG